MVRSHVLRFLDFISDSVHSFTKLLSTSDTSLFSQLLILSPKSATCNSEYKAGLIRRWAWCLGYIYELNIQRKWPIFTSGPGAAAPSTPTLIRACLNMLFVLELSSYILCCKYETRSRKKATIARNLRKPSMFVLFQNEAEQSQTALKAVKFLFTRKPAKNWQKKKGGVLRVVYDVTTTQVCYLHDRHV